VIGVTANEGSRAAVEGVASLATPWRSAVAYCKGNGEGSTMARFLSGAGVPAYPSVHRASTVAGALARYHSRRERTTSEGGA
jgi:acyl-CoA synthetase (NDP forming)